MSILQNKEQIQDIENSIDQYIFFEMMKNYSDLIEQLKPIAEGSGSTPHSLLMDYMFFKMEEERDKINQDRLGV
jgi:DNA integrity scanning protein DisA with diadenylate cyclase activity